MPAPSEVFARTVLALQPYAAEVVFIGGWVHALYLAEVSAADPPVWTEDIDVTLPHQLLTAGRPTLLDLVAAAGYEIQEIGQESGIVEIFQPGPRNSVIELDLLTEAPDPLEKIPIEGQPDLTVHGYPGQHVLLENARWMDVGRDVHEMLDPPVRIRVPTLSAYLLGKGLSSRTRTRLTKQAKDLVYLFEIARHPVLGRTALAGMPELAARYPADYAQWRSHLLRVLDDARLLGEVVDQLQAAFRVIGGAGDVLAAVRARIRRLLGETPPSETQAHQKFG